jgi:hypothetical protein
MLLPGNRLNEFKVKQAGGDVSDGVQPAARTDVFNLKMVFVQGRRFDWAWCRGGTSSSFFSKWSKREVQGWLGVESAS